MDKQQIQQIVREEAKKLIPMNDMDLILNFSKLKAMNINAPSQDDKDITHGILLELEKVMKERNIMVEEGKKVDNEVGMVISIPSPISYNPKNIVKKNAKLKGKLTFHQLMNMNEERVIREGEPV